LAPPFGVKENPLHHCLYDSSIRDFLEKYTLLEEAKIAQSF